MNKISIIMPIYNEAEYLSKAVDSALKQSSENWELILVDDGSTDHSSQICDQYEQQYPEKITVIHQNNLGSGEARNKGLAQASGDYIYFADSDDYFTKDLVEDNLAILSESKAELLSFGYIEEKYTVKEEYIPKVPQITKQDMFRDHFRNFNHVSPYALWNKIYKKSYLKEHNIYFGNEKLGQDALFNIRVFQHLNTVSVNHKSYYQYQNNQHSSVNRYRPDRFDLEFKIAKEFENLLISWGRQEEFYDLIQRNYWNALYAGLVMTAHPDNPLTQEEKELKVQLQLTNDNIRFYLNEDFAETEANPFRRTLLKLLLNKKIKQAIYLMKFRNTFSSNFATLFGWMRKPVIRK